MFNIGFSELVLILLVALIFVGPKDLPKVGAAIGRAVRKMKTYLDEFKEETGLDEAEAAYKETAKELNQIVREADPTKEIRDVEKEIKKAGRKLEQTVREATEQVKND